MPNPNRRGPRALSEILGELFTVKGYGQLRALGELEEAWNTAVGEPHCHQTRVGEVRRGVLTVIVAHPTLLEELAAFRKPELLQALRAGAPATPIQDIRFRVGPIDQPAAPERNRNATRHNRGQRRHRAARVQEQVRGPDPGGGRAPATMTAIVPMADDSGE